MATDTYATIARKLDAIMPFDNKNSMSAKFDGPIYKVLSYRTLIATYDNNTGERWINPDRYSVTTSRQQGLIRRVWGMR